MSAAADFLPLLRGPVPLSHLLLTRYVSRGDTVIDATCGNGSDTLLLAELAGEGGTVWAFDIQPEALQATAERLAEAGLAGRVRLVHCGHENLAAHVTGPVKGVVFNLGYLPGSDRSVVTRPETTVSALDQALEMLQPGGVICIVIYPGHDGGSEAAAVAAWAADRPQKECHVWRMGQLNVPADAPYLILIQKVS